MNTYDITGGVSWFFNTLFGLLSTMFEFLDSIIFLGISLLDFIIVLNLLSVIVPLLFARLKANSTERGLNK